MNNFLPTDYEVPDKAGNYMKLQDGANRIRILGSAIVGWEGWKTQKDGSKKPVRKRLSEQFPMSEVDDEDRVKHFWAFPVWNYQEERVQILELTQKSIQKAIKALVADEDWGTPTGYDLVITRSGQKLETEYQVQPKPAKELDKEITKQYNEMNINLEALFENGDPFESTNEKVDVDDVPDFDK